MQQASTNCINTNIPNNIASWNFEDYENSSNEEKLNNADFYII